jgi:hypothetical protein
MEDADLQVLFDFVKDYRRRLTSGEDMWASVVGFQNALNDRIELEEAIAVLGDSPAGRAFEEIREATERGRQFIGLLNAQELTELGDELLRAINAFLSFESFYQGTRGLSKMKQLGKAGLPVPSDVESRVVGFLSPAGRAESVSAALSRAATSVGKPGVRSDAPTTMTVERDESPPGGTGPAAAGAGGPAGGKRRRKTRKGKSKRRRYSRRR